MDHRLLVQLVCRPGNAPSVVAVGGGEEGGLSEFLPQLVGGENGVGKFGNVPAGFGSNVAGHCKGAAQDLESVESEAVGLILDIDVLQS